MNGFDSDQIYQLNQLAEPVDFSGAIQPHGVLLALTHSELMLLQVSANVETYFGRLPQALIGQPLTALLDAAAVEFIQQELTADNSRLSFRTCTHDRWFDGVVHWTAAALILELEPVGPHLISGPFYQRPMLIQPAIARLRQVSDLTQFLQAAAAEVHRITGFDRIMIYQFDAQGAGAVVAEAKRSNLSSYLGLHYPATDIPEPVRALYRQGLIRYIPDLNATQVALIPNKNSITDQPLSLQQVNLRGVDACCVEYHQNMGVAALMVIALVQGETLWGLISCHHQTPKFVAYEVRESCEVLGHWVASELANKVNTEELDCLTKLRSLQSEFVQSIAQVEDLRQALVEPAPRLLELVNAEGAAVCLEDEITLVGKTPSTEQIQALMQWISTFTTQPVLFHTDSLPKLYPVGVACKDTASGLLVLQISQVRRYAILWFRPEVLRTVNWAGDPHIPQATADGGLRLGPRQSFEQWQEIVRFTSLPWKSYELENAIDLRSAIVGIVLQKADELTRINQALERTNQELDSFAYAASHDLKEPLRGIHNFSNLLLKGYADVLDEVGQSRLQTLIRLTRRMEALIDALLKFSRLGQAELRLQPTDLNQAVQQVIEDLAVSRPDLSAEIYISRSLPMVDCDPVLIRDILLNLITNAIKYNDKATKWVEIGYLEPAVAANHLPTADIADIQSSYLQAQNLPQDLPPIFYVRDNGIGIRERHLQTVFRLFKRLHEQHLYGGGTGAGLTIAKKIIERHGGTIWVESSYQIGSTFYFTLAASQLLEPKSTTLNYAAGLNSQFSDQHS